jgi:hypothetical protein
MDEELEKEQRALRRERKARKHFDVTHETPTANKKESETKKKVTRRSTKESPAATSSQNVAADDSTIKSKRGRKRKSELDDAKSLNDSKGTNSGGAGEEGSDCEAIYIEDEEEGHASEAINKSKMNKSLNSKKARKSTSYHDITIS